MPMCRRIVVSGPRSRPDCPAGRRHPRKSVLNACPTGQSPLYVRPSRSLTVMTSPAHLTSNVLICREFCSLRLSVRTPPFHGGESGSIPLGSANVSNAYPIRAASPSNVTAFNAHACGHDAAGEFRRRLRGEPDAHLIDVVLICCGRLKLMFNLTRRLTDSFAPD